MAEPLRANGERGFLALPHRLSTLNAAMSKFGQTLKGYIWWTYPRGSVQYDVMVTLILAFIFLTPLWVNFRDKPTGAPAASD